MNTAWLQALAVAMGGAIGALLRHGVNLLLPRPAHYLFAPSTLVVNVAGCFLAGLLLIWIDQRDQTGLWRALLLTGLLGGLTTFSAFGLDLLPLLREQRWAGLALVIAVHLGLGLAAVMLGSRIGRWICSAG